MVAEVRQAVGGYIQPCLQLVVRSAVVLFILSMLVLVHPLLALVSLTMLATAYGCVFLLVRRRLKRIGRLRAEANRDLFQTATEALAGVKDIKILGREIPFLVRFGSARAATPATWPSRR